MKQMIICFTLVVMGANVAMTQTGERRGQVQDRVEAQRVAFITQQLNLTPDESAAFWPLYNEFKARQKTMRQEIRPGKSIDQLNDAEASALINAQLDLEIALAGVKRDYFGRLGKVVPASKLVKLGHAEQAFNRRVLNTIRNRQNKN